jgi:hypothetical protein
MLFDTKCLQNMAEAVRDQYGTATGNRLGLYSGSPPADAESFTVAGYAGQALITFVGMSFSRSGAIVQMATAPTSVSAAATGTAAWAALYNVTATGDCVLFTSGDVSTITTPVQLSTGVVTGAWDTTYLTDIAMQFTDS